MGYYTRYDLNIISTDDSAGLTKKDIIADIRQSSDGAQYGLNDNGTCCNELKWYDHETELKALSKLYPTYILELSGEGEEQGHIWKKYFKNGKVQYEKAQITFGKFDEKLLK